MCSEYASDHKGLISSWAYLWGARHTLLKMTFGERTKSGNDKTA
jgi:hypothetical protein